MWTTETTTAPLIRSVTVGKSRQIKLKPGKESWLRAEIMQQYAGEPTAMQVKEQLDDVEFILEQEERDERSYWQGIEDQLRQHQTWQDPKPQPAADHNVPA